ncbi:MAG: radical SAM protein [Rhodospirillales bacterium]|nr:radical SAM protein [Rhodospirillales bacterium]
MPDSNFPAAPPLDPRKFKHPDVTAGGETRAAVPLAELKTLWFNTGSLCNLACVGCYMESSPANDRLAYITTAEAAAYLDEIRDTRLPVEEIGFTGGEPFMNPDFIAMLELALSRGFKALVLTNAMKPMDHKRDELLRLKAGYGGELSIRVSIDHPTRAHHEELRGPGSWGPMIDGVKWLGGNGFNLAIAGRTRWEETEEQARRAYAKLFAELEISVDASDPAALVLFPEMDETLDVPEITAACWDILGVHPDHMMCATSRMVIKRKGAGAPMVAPCTLLPYDTRFEMGGTLADAAGAVKLNHPHCARFCVLGGGACSVQA